MDGRKTRVIEERRRDDRKKEQKKDREIEKSTWGKEGLGSTLDQCTNGASLFNETGSLYLRRTEERGLRKGAERG